MNRCVVRAALLLGVAVAPIAATEAFDLKPIMAQLTPSGPGSSRSFVIQNTHTQPIAVELKMFKRQQDLAGTDKREPDEDDFVIAPAQMVIAPGQSQNVRLQWIGDANTTVERSFRMVAEQLPISFEQKSTGDRQAEVQVQYRYEAALYVTPPASKPHVTLVSAEPAKDGSGAPMLKLRLKSDGTRRAILDKPQLDVTAAGAPSAALSGPGIASLNNINILAGAEREVLLPWPKNLPYGPVTANLRTEYLTF